MKKRHDLYLDTSETKAAAQKAKREKDFSLSMLVRALLKRYLAGEVTP